MAWIPDDVRKIADQVRDTGQPYKTTARTLLGFYLARRRGRLISGQIRSGLKEAGLATRPDFETAYIDGELELTLLQVQPDGAAATAVAEQVAAAAPVEIVTGGSVSDPVARIRMLAAANRIPLSVKRDNAMAEAITLMLLHDFSQLPVLANERDVSGMISWRSVGRAVGLNRPHEFVRECMEDAVEILDDSPLLDAIALIAQHEAVLVRQRDKKIVGLVTTSDLSLEFQTLAEPFLLLGEIENHLRRLIDGRFSREALEAVRDAADAARAIGDVADLTFGEYIRLLQNPANWDCLNVGLDRARLCEHLDRIRQIRNDVMHFNPDGTSEEDLEALRDTVKFLQQL